MKKNDRITVECIDYTEDGAGVCRTDGLVVFVPGLIRGEKAEIGINKMKKNYGYGRIVNILTPSQHRREPACTANRLCGGCTLQHMDDSEQRYFKENKVRNCFRQNAGMDPEILPILKVQPYERYRNKVQIPVQFNAGKTEMGFYQTHTNRIIPYEDCLVQTELSNRIKKYFEKEITMLRNASSIRHLLIKHAHRTGEVMAVIICREYPFHNSEALVNGLLEEFPQIASLSAIINKKETNVILDGKEVLIHGRPYIEEELLGCRFRISARSFYQINPYATEILYSKAVECAGLTGSEILIDLYCGTGTIGMIASRKAKKVYGIEIVADAVKDAKINAQINGIDNIEFFNMDASKGAQAILRSKIKADVIIVDPPRKGCSKDTLDAMITISPGKIVYVSCDPATLARDVKILSEAGYELKTVQPVDMFPHTAHIETIVLLQKSNS
ncbi:MAG: 23S rRNA (uracil(1939)-C(5))-methyltransferase RlmD [Solobacterium sp.]|nr:23S rRNA (uracil(1939)-C(5))-methyltransferase RlmD [Solobacterium sp.]